MNAADFPLPEVPTNVKDLTGLRFGSWTVLKYVGVRKHRAFFLCRCDCGTEKEISGPSLSFGHSQSCGCVFGVCKVKHGEASPPTIEYSCWKELRGRCKDVENERYGGRETPVQFCEGFNDYNHFLKIMGRKPPEKQHIDRIENQLHYSCGECPQCIREGWKMNLRWATYDESFNNKSNSVFLEFQGIKLSVSQWERKLGVKPGSIKSRLQRGWPVERALSEAIKKPGENQYSPGYVKYLITQGICHVQGEFELGLSKQGRSR